MTDREIGAGADAVRVERASECRQHRQILFQSGGEVKVHPITGTTYIQMPPRYREEIKLKHPIPGLKVFDCGTAIAFEFISKDCIEEPECIDAQCQAGWNDIPHGFGNLQIGILPDGSHRATWSCGATCE